MPPVNAVAWIRLVSCLLLLALPFKGMAGVAPGLCLGHTGGAHAGHATVLVAMHTPELSHAAAHHSMHSHPVSLDAAADALVPGAAGEKPAAATHPNTPVAGHACSHCAACCAGGALPAGVTMLELPPVARQAFPEPFFSHQPPLLSGLDRPPQFRTL